MKTATENILKELISRYPALSGCEDDIRKAFEILLECYSNGKKLLVAGNGGSAADSEHIVGELMKRFRKPRAINADVYEKLSQFGSDGEKLRVSLEGALPAVSLTSHTAFSTAFANDREPKISFAQQLYGLGERGDVALLISTSGNSENLVYCAEVAFAKDIKTIALTGKNESRLSELCLVTIKVPETETFKVQELHLPVYHCLCAMLEEEIF